LRIIALAYTESFVANAHQTHGHNGCPVRAMALELLDEWRLVAADPAFRAWLASGARSDDAMRPDR